MDDGKGEGWSPAMASSPEATMLDCATVEHRAASPALLSRLAAPPDISDNNANPAPVPSDQDTQQPGAERLTPAADTQAAPGTDRLASAEEAVTVADSTVGEVAAAQPENLTDNFSFLAARGLISSSEGSGEASTSITTTTSSTSNEVEEEVVGCDSSSSVVAPSTQTQVADSSSDSPGPT